MDVRNAPSIDTNEQSLDIAHDFTYLSSALASNVSTDADIN